MAQDSFSFLALGDSYTIGEAVLEEDRWPVQLVNRLRNNGIDITNPKIIATTGWTTDELQKGIIEDGVSGTFDLVSLLIGVNNQYRGYPMEQYQMEFKELLTQAIEFAGGKEEHVFVVSIPDYGVTTYTSDNNLDPMKIERELDSYNEKAFEIADKLGVKTFEITKWSRKAKDDASLVASDGLHPSGKMYENWVETCFSWVFRNLENRSPTK